LQDIASTIVDYRKGEISPPDVEHVNRWISQFAADVRDPILQEVNHVLKRTYVTRSNVNDFLGGLSGHKELTGGKRKKFWTEANILKISGSLGRTDWDNLMHLLAVSKLSPDKASLSIELLFSPESDEPRIKILAELARKFGIHFRAL